jgi:hypothetical protein
VNHSTQAMPQNGIAFFHPSGTIVSTALLVELHKENVKRTCEMNKIPKMDCGYSDAAV